MEEREDKESSQVGQSWAWIARHAAENLKPEQWDALAPQIEATAQLIEEIAPQDREMVAAAMLYSYHHWTGIDPIVDLEEVTGETVFGLLQGTIEMTMLHLHSHHGGGESQHENLRKMLLAMAQDVRVVVIKLAEHLLRMQFPMGLSKEARRENAQLTRDVLAPLANRLGMGALKWKLEDFAFRVLEPTVYKELSRKLNQKRGERDSYISLSISTIEEALEKAELNGEVSGRTKHLYSIWKKMQRKQVEIESLYDLHAVRILVDDVADCYAALGIVHGLWPHISKEFDDYIANPKGNNYRSIHTAVHGPEGRVLEIQIRTHEMHDAAELGVAAHWRYKEGTRYDPGFERKINWLRQLLEWKDELSEQEGMVDQFHDEMVEELVYVLTPQGEIVELPEGATALDFAYSIHTGLGHRTRGAKIDGKIIPLNQPLQSGQRVEILTVKEGGPTRDWMNPNLGYLHTSRARYRVRQWFRKQDYEENVAAGRTILERELARAGSPNLPLEHLVQRYEQKNLEALHAAIGQGDITCGQLAGGISTLVSPPPVQKKRPRKAVQEEESSPDAISIRGVGKLMTRFANCCQPTNTDPIIGFITRGRGITIHHQECPNALHLIETEPERVIEVSWGVNESSMQKHQLLIKAHDRSGLLNDITTLFRNKSINIDAINTSTDRESHTAQISIDVEMEAGRSIGEILDQLLRMKNILSASCNHD